MHANPIEAQMARLEGSFEQVNERLSSVDRRLDSLEQRTALRFDQMDRRFNWLVGLVVGTWGTTILGIIFRH